MSEAAFAPPADAPAVDFPPDGAEIEALPEGLLLRVRGGRAPFTWLVDGAPAGLASPPPEALGPAPGPGFVTLAVIDALGRSAAVATVSRDHQRKVSALFPAADVRYVPNGIDPAEWSLAPNDLDRAARWRAEHAGEGRRVLGMFGHLKRKKGGAFLLDALRRAGVEGKLHLLVVGEAEPEMLAHLASIESTVPFTHVPFVDRFELLPWYAACDGVVVPSLYDGLPNVLLEAGALGVPAVASTAGGMADLLEDEGRGLTFPPGDLHECRRALGAFATLPDGKLRTMGERLRGAILRGFRHDQEAARYRTLLAETAGRAPRPAPADVLTES